MSGEDTSTLVVLELLVVHAMRHQDELLKIHSLEVTLRDLNQSSKGSC